MIHKLFQFSIIVCKEFKSPVNYVMALLIGVIITIAQGDIRQFSLAPFIIPLLVQAFTKASVNFRNRDINLLLCLPAERKDPAFIMDNNGNIILSSGNSKKMFQRHTIHNLYDLFNREDSIAILDAAKKSVLTRSVEIIDFYSHILKKWYQVQLKFDASSQHILVWLEGMTKRKELDARLAKIRSFSNEIITSVKEVSKSNDIYDRLSILILQDGYGGVFIAIKENDGSFAGHAYKMDNAKLLKSDLLNIKSSSSASVLKSGKLKRVISGETLDYESQETFEKEYSFYKGVKDFLGFPINNFINYQEGEVSIISFNKEGKITNFDLSVMETMVNTARSATYLIDLAVQNDEKFLQIITGLASASEYSDELTGKHILRVNQYSKLIAGYMGCTEEFVEHIGQVAALHDIGKVGIPEIIKLERKLTVSEIEEMQMHVIYGAQIIEKLIAQSKHSDSRLEMARNIALNHHQRWDGKGYTGLINDKEELIKPESKNSKDYIGLKPLKGDDIPIEALIVSLADKYDALRSARQYKPAFTHSKTTEILLKDDRSGSDGKDVFGKNLIELYLEIQDKMNAIYEDMKG